MKRYSKEEIRRGQLEMLQIKAYQSLRFYRARLLAEETAEEEDIVPTVEAILRWDAILMATHRRLGDMSAVIDLIESGVAA